VIPEGFGLVGAVVCAKASEFIAIMISIKAENFMSPVSRLIVKDLDDIFD
jgi:hypothetical protein